MERLNKTLAAAGLGSRRKCEELILTGRVEVDGERIMQLGVKVGPEQTVAVDGRPIQLQRFVYWVVNKPKGYLCTNYEPGGRPKVLDLIPHVGERVYTVGRLDEASEGLILLTNDGGLAQRLTHPRFGVQKTYLVQVAGKPTREELGRLVKGIWIAEGKVRAKRIRRIGKRGDSTFLQIVLSEGKNREIRRMLAKLGHKVMQLKRVAIGPVRLSRLKRGKARRLSLPEVKALREVAQGGRNAGPKTKAKRATRSAKE